MRFFIIPLFCLLSVSLSVTAQQRTTRFDGGEGSYSGKFRYSAGSERITLKGITGTNFTSRFGFGLGYGKILRRERSWQLEGSYYHNTVDEREVADVVSASLTCYWSLIKLGSGSRVLFGLSPEVGYQYAKSLKIESAEVHSVMYGLGARLEYEHLLGGVGFFFGLSQSIECLTRIQQARLRHFIDVGFRIGI
ncbi:MAG: hypothetical protein LBK47_06655 [Prevotellaceae bacterium]|jgi:hypothetical protein|nr:hypothetical protein [Prevotellaceae bacterium]